MFRWPDNILKPIFYEVFYALTQRFSHIIIIFVIHSKSLNIWSLYSWLHTGAKHSRNSWISSSTTFSSSDKVSNLLASFADIHECIKGTSGSSSSSKISKALGETPFFFQQFSNPSERFLLVYLLKCGGFYCILGNQNFYKPHNVLSILRKLF